MIKQKPSSFIIILYAVAFIVAPLLVTIGTLLWLLYWYGLGGRHKNQPFLVRFKRIKRKWFIFAALLTLLTLPIHFTTAYATHFGFPTTVITYYGLPTRMVGIAYWFDPLIGSATNPLQALVNWVFYLLLLLLLEQLWQTVRTWRKIGV